MSYVMMRVECVCVVVRNYTDGEVLARFLLLLLLPLLLLVLLALVDLLHHGQHRDEDIGAAECVEIETVIDLN